MRNAVLLVFTVACSSSPTRSLPSNDSAAARTVADSRALKTPCVDPGVDASERLAILLGYSDEERRDAGPRREPGSARFDLDGDGTPDLLFADSRVDVPTTLVYLVRGACGHLVAEFKGDMKLLAEQTNGMADLEASYATTEADGPDNDRLVVKHLRFDGNRYVE